MTGTGKMRFFAPGFCGALVAAALAFVAPATVALAEEPPSASVVVENDLETYSLADRSNLRRLDNGDFLFRLARDLRSDVTYWAYMGSTRHVIAVTPTPASLTDEQARSVLLRVTELPARVGCGVGLIHRSWVYIVPEEATFANTAFAPKVSPLLAKGEVQNDVSGQTPVELLSFTSSLAAR